ncbi:MAG: hypothetical protein ACKOEO_26185 [Planctomycetaceae bacterium]
MLTEFAFTPSIFDEDAHEDKDAWRDQLRELNSSMFPRTSVWPIVVSNLYAGSWSSHVRRYVERMQDHVAKRYCQSLLTNMERMLVVRPDCRDWPNDDDVEWSREAVAAHQQEPIERIISTGATRRALVSDFNMIRSIDEVMDAGFWRGIESDASPRMVIAEQVKLLRKLCLHSEWIAVINAHGFGSEQDFSLQLLETAFRRPPGYGPIHGELHAEAPDVSDVAERSARQERVAFNMTRNIERSLKAPHKVDLYFWPKLLDRVIVAGNFVKESDGTTRKRPRWGVSMNHVARGSEPNIPPTEWKLLRPESLNEWFRNFVAEDAAGKSPAINVNTRR